MLSIKFLIFFELVFIFLFTINANVIDNNCRNICLTPTCVKEAAKILEAIDENISPCNDFYAFTCKKWIDSTVLPESKSSYTRFTQLQDEINYKLKELLEKTSSKTEKRQFIMKAKNYYDSCMNTTLIEKLGDKPLVDLLTQLGEWPLALRTQWTEIPWTELYIKLRKLGLINSMLFSLSVGIDIRNNSRQILILDQPSFGLNRDLLLKGKNSSYVSAYKSLIINSAVKLGTIKYFAEQHIDDILQFETKLADLSMNKLQRRDLSLVYNKMTIKELETISTRIDWLKIIRNFTSDTVTEDDDIVSYDTSFIISLNLLLNNTQNRVLANYIIWRVVQSKLGSLSSDWVKLKDDLDSVVYGRKISRARWEQCLTTVDSSMHIVLSNLFVKNFFDEENKQKALEIASNVKKEFNKTLNEAEWIKGETLVHALKKLENMKLLVGYPEELNNDSEVSAHYEMLNFDPLDYFGNIRSVNKWSKDLIFNNIRKPSDIRDWRKIGSLTKVNAFYNRVKNLAIIPAGILQGVFFNKDRPNYLNYGTIARSSSHEIIHGFDNLGRQYDKNGNYNNWWDEKTDQKYRAKAKCIVEQYSNYTVEEIGLHINGVLTQSENIADNGGIKLAFRSYLSSIQNSGPELRLPALDYTPEQLFFISFGVYSCTKQTDEYLKDLIKYDPHTPKKLRVNGVLSNSEDFSKLFKCPIGSPMNPLDKCSVW